MRIAHQPPANVATPTTSPRTTRPVASIQSLSIAYGLGDDVQVGATLGYYWGSNFIDAEADGGGGADSSIADPEGLTDLWLNAKWRVMHGEHGHLALIAGVKLPTGKDDERLDNGTEQGGQGHFGPNLYGTCRPNEATICP